MSNPIQWSAAMPPIEPAGPILPREGSAPAGGEFHSILLRSLDEVNRLQQEADTGVQRLLTGQTDNVAEVLAAANKAGVAFDLLMEIRNKLTDAYKEIQQMRV